MKFNLKGRLANFDLPVSKALNPLFEAIVNSIHSIEEKYDNPQDGRIDITVIRVDGQLQMGDQGDRYIQPIDGFIIEDNGIGFDERNYASFETSDSTYKLELGEKVLADSLG